MYNFPFFSKQIRFYFSFIAVIELMCALQGQFPHAWKASSIKNSYTFALRGGIVTIKLKILIKLYLLLSLK